MSTIRDFMGEAKGAQQAMDQDLRRSLSGSPSHDERMRSGSWSPPVDIFESDDRILLRADLPGISIEQVELKIENERIILQGERSRGPARLQGEFHRTERPHGRFYRIFALPRSIHQSEIRAVLENGVLEVILPKRTETRAKPIKVEAR